jgi:hypothetical protein
LSVFDSESEELLYEIPVPGVDPVAVRRLWGTPGSAPIGSLALTDVELPFVNAHLDPPFLLREGEAAFLELVQDYPGETITEADGTTWYPPP